MATTRIISMHVNQGKTIADCLTDRIDYSKNPDKTQGGELISAYECDPKTADAEFLLLQAAVPDPHRAGSSDSDVIAYQVRQSFKPGEITPEEANRVGYEFAERFLKGQTRLFCGYPYRQAAYSQSHHLELHHAGLQAEVPRFSRLRQGGRTAQRRHLHRAPALRHRSDPKRGKNHYGKWLGDNAKPTHRELLCGLIDAALLQKPDSFDALLKLLARQQAARSGGAGIRCPCATPDKKGFVRLSSINGYSEDELRAVLAGEKEHTPRRKTDAGHAEKGYAAHRHRGEAASGKGRGLRALGKGIQRQADGADLQLSPGARLAGL